ncbi:uncharacterized protein PV07_04493 [Cladophialophora immunda]|uniref:Uncharacterized protein n=1 Tax=Cladophialophora immunda TaxID=569365 RepID=A0A0D2CP71_9EURO|nr:uncharacterized protein PV07_04493 [Cladophialophora immunda]KIW32988.1 hypothetical protein PV07_04493 [Cladophialophora immunda]
MSSLYHLMLPSSHPVERFWHGMDLLGIVVVTVGTSSSDIYYVFFCEASLQKLHWAIILTTGTAMLSLQAILPNQKLALCHPLLHRQATTLLPVPMAEWQTNRRMWALVLFTKTLLRNGFRVASSIIP